MVSVAWAKTRFMQWHVGICFAATGRPIGIYPLKQIAPVIHGNHPVRAASQWTKTPGGKLSGGHTAVITSFWKLRVAK
jgi:hypothetical protein